MSTETHKPGTYQHEPTRERAKSIVSCEVLLCVSPLISNMATHGGCAALDICEDALYELCSRTRAVWNVVDAGGDYVTDYTDEDDADEHAERIDGSVEEDEETLEAYEHWVVSDWLAANLEADGEIVTETNIGSIWGRCTTGQSIAMDAAILDIAARYLPEGA